MENVPTPRRAYFFLDLLELEICERIARHVTGGCQTEAALNLAESSPKQCHAVLSIFAFRLKIDAEMRDSFRWVELFKNKVCDVELDWCPVVHPEPHLLAILMSPSLFRAEIAEQPAFLHAIALSSSIKDLAIISCDDNKTSLLFHVLPILHLSRLSIRCARKSLTCHFHNMLLFNKDYNVLAETCPHLSALEIDCKCCKEGTMPIWKIFPQMNSLREVRLESKDASGEEVLNLQSLDIVRIWGERAHELAIRVGSPVTELSDPSHLTSQQISSLGVCHRLKVLNIHIVPGAENGLHQCFRSLSSIRELRLHWSGTWDNCCEPEAGIVLNVVKDLPYLTHLALTEVILSCGELAAIMRHVGCRLSEFRTMVSGQEEPSADRLEALLEETSKHNPSLRVFDTSISDTLVNEPEHPTPDAERQRNSHQGTRIRILIERLKRRAPLLDPDPLEHFIDLVLPFR